MSDDTTLAIKRFSVLDEPTGSETRRQNLARLCFGAAVMIGIGLLCALALWAAVFALSTSQIPPSHASTTPTTVCDSVNPLDQVPNC